MKITPGPFLAPESAARTTSSRVSNVGEVGELAEVIAFEPVRGTRRGRDTRVATRQRSSDARSGGVRPMTTRAGILPASSGLIGPRPDSHDPIRIGFQVWGQHVAWADLMASGARIEELGFASLLANDHLMPVLGGPDGPLVSRV